MKTGKTDSESRRGPRARGSRGQTPHRRRHTLNIGCHDPGRAQGPRLQAGRERHHVPDQARRRVLRPVQDVAPTARAICRHGRHQGNAAGKCNTIRRTERSTHTASLINRSRSVVTCASAQTVRCARRGVVLNAPRSAAVWGCFYTLALDRWRADRLRRSGKSCTGGRSGRPRSRVLPGVSGFPPR